MTKHGRKMSWIVFVALAIAALLMIAKVRDVQIAHASTGARADVKHAVSSVARAQRIKVSRVHLTARVLPEASLPPLPETFKETSVDGGFFVDDQGHLVLSESALRLFNYFFSATGKESEEVILSRIVHEIDRRLASPAREEAKELLEGFVAYRHAGRELAGEMRKFNQDEQVEALYALRREAFGEKTAEQLFKRDELLRGVQMARTRVLQDETLGDDEKRVALSTIERELPEEIRARRDQSLAAQRAYEEVEALRARGADPKTIHAARAKLLGEEAAARLAALDQREAAFNRELEQLRRLSTALDDVSQEERTSVTQGFIDERFPEDQRARARAQLDAGFPLLNKRPGA